MNHFGKLFEEYGFTIMPWENDASENSFIAHNDTFCVLCTVVDYHQLYSLMAAVSFLKEDMDAIIRTYKEREFIGHEVFNDYMNNRLKFTQVGRICNHDYSMFEITTWLQRMYEKKSA